MTTRRFRLNEFSLASNLVVLKPVRSHAGQSSSTRSAINWDYLNFERQSPDMRDWPSTLYRHHLRSNDQWNHKIDWMVHSRDYFPILVYRGRDSRSVKDFCNGRRGHDCYNLSAPMRFLLLLKTRKPPGKRRSSNAVNIETCSFSLLQIRKATAQGDSTINRIGGAAARIHKPPFSSRCSTISAE